MKEKTILVIDDDEEFVHLMELRLNSMGFKVIKAESGDDALMMVSEKLPDLVILDIFLSDMDGLTILKRMKAPIDIETGEPSATKDIPVIVITGKAPMVENMTRIEGAVDFFIKPIDTEKFVKCVTQILKGAQK
ncbi:MAG: hypothetical protein A3G33_05705 [Omnitrophica bacterium RIFCSPLOWO2_12_FULL_44_17]|uniref:Response regulatory domain-containing protein n=1 Tax=Candidatus Danuiimicrobium aquiferis TaxID=1801832 RepID=A0A1G1L351_9BACT|nr:MAG: hypothetical protein A3B72_05185 [Omnitrophica bacterium RIFCSPHIGHO2_02_FULL_45_28]OGW89890.1 MAG: hypothetical protein A3E74_01825 [Omnitrophica bacterium RIFCSPHIGHO2_12_FULL_44_12]OGW99566.1 MAG: hypothetical protein A3G33_05705 [Omnitrophica bacterium RIFCSPLOWO2_12_FULL_44_17]OGX04015.1 MAG: hypothetical protein A3J12_06245 [Omnitrophica bacterium RIFCSPLOWO2_02_FULL_44_11]